MKRSLLWLAFVSALALGACGSTERREAAVLAQAVERFRMADNANKTATALALRAVPCTAPEVCRARDACLASAEATGKALRLKSEVEQGIAALEKGTLSKESPEAKGLAQKLDDAELLLREGHEAMPKCEEQISALKRRLQL